MKEKEKTQYIKFTKKTIKFLQIEESESKSRAPSTQLKLI